MKSSFPGDHFIQNIDRSIVKLLMKAEPSCELFRMTSNLRLFCLEIVKQGGFPADTIFDVTIDDPDRIGEVTFSITRRHTRQVNLLTVDLSNEVFEAPKCFWRVVNRLVQMATALREHECPCN